MALLAGDPATAGLALDRLIATGAHGRALDVDRTAIQAGLAALEGRRADAIAGYRSAIAGWRDLGLPWDEAITSIEFVRLLGSDEPVARARPRTPRERSSRGLAPSGFSTSSTSRCNPAMNRQDPRSRPPCRHARA